MRLGAQWMAALLLGVVGSGVAAPAQGEWVTVAKDREREVQLDPDTVMPAGAGVKVAWGRVILAPEEAARVGFASVRALNRFDCQRRTFVTVKRVYLDAEGMPLREEAVNESQPAPIAKGSVDERLWRAVCQPVSPQELIQTAEGIGKIKSAMEGESGKKEGRGSTKGERKSAPAGGQGPGQTGGEGIPPIPLGVDLADPSALPPELAAQPVPNLLPPRLGKERLALTGMALPGGEGKGRGTQPAAGGGETTVKSGGEKEGEGIRKEKGKEEGKAEKKGGGEQGRERRLEGLVVQVPGREGRPTAREGERRPQRSEEGGSRGRKRKGEGRETSRQEGWSFSGGGGPEAWGRLRPEWRLCTQGRRQAPVTLERAIPADVPPPRWVMSPFWATVSKGEGEVWRLVSDRPLQVIWQGTVWGFEAATWHRPPLHRLGEERVGEWVLQFRSGTERLFVVLPVRGGERTVPELEALARALERGEERGVRLRWDWRGFLPVEERFFVYEGSEPWPPCAENVRWLVFAEGGEAVRAEIAPLLMGPGTARPPQPLYGRLVLEGGRGR
ncbi:MAG: carbonic anhydrase family protein [Hydrogenophilus sp.]|nr:carbonic anhydrase family protein [Hydrogenophilus sp.]